MKKLTLLLVLAFSGIYAQDAVNFTAEIQNPNSDTLMVANRQFKQIIPGADGKFTGSLSVTPGLYQLFDGKEYAVLYLKNGFDLHMTMDAKMFDETIHFTGKGAAENNYLAKMMLDNQKLSDSFQTADANDLKTMVDNRMQQEEKDLADESLDAGFRDVMKQQMAAEKQQLTMMVQQTMAAQKMRGKPSPSFTYENHAGGTTSLSDFKGKYVYIDVWATWCGPCRAEIPHLKEVEEKYKGKNIAFVSISVDKQNAHDKWKKMVTDSQLGGTQLMSDNDWNSAFITAYDIHSIPRFILIDPQGNVVDADAARPSNPDLQKQLDKLLK